LTTWQLVALVGMIPEWGEGSLGKLKTAGISSPFLSFILQVGILFALKFPRSCAKKYI
jgi:hypothetical protein